MKKRIILVGIIGVLLIAVMVFSLKLSQAFSAEIPDGIYKISNEQEYKDAYIEVKNDSIRFYNIDLNAIYREGQLDNIYNYIENGMDLNVSDEELTKLSDLNKMYVENAYEIDYEQSEENKVGTFKYTYFCLSDLNIFGFVLEYDSWNRTIKINSSIREIVFEK